MLLSRTQVRKRGLERRNHALAAPTACTGRALVLASGLFVPLALDPQRRHCGSCDLGVVTRPQGPHRLGLLAAAFAPAIATILPSRCKRSSSTSGSADAREFNGHAARQSIV